MWMTKFFSSRKLKKSKLKDSNFARCRRMNFIILINQSNYKCLQLNLHNRITVSLQET